MAVFSNQKYRTASYAKTFAGRYRAALHKNHFWVFGLPFLTIIVGASFALTPITAVRYERHDRRVAQVTREEELGIGKGSRKVDMREEYNVSASPPICDYLPLIAVMVQTCQVTTCYIGQIRKAWH